MSDQDPASILPPAKKRKTRAKRATRKPATATSSSSKYLSIGSSVTGLTLLILLVIIFWPRHSSSNVNKTPAAIMQPQQVALQAPPPQQETPLPPPPPQAPAPLPAVTPSVLNITQVNVDVKNSPGANIINTISTAGGNSQQQVCTDDWTNQPPTRREDLGRLSSDILRPEDNVEYTIPHGSVVTPRPEGSTPPNAIGWVPVNPNPCGYQVIHGGWQCDSIRMRVSPWWHQPVKVDFNCRHNYR